METFKAGSDWALILLPFLATILACINAYEGRGRRWRLILNIALAMVLFGLGCFGLS